MKSLFVFRRDLRLEDNTALIQALSDSDQVIPCFILDPRQLESNEYRSLNAIQFMFESLRELNSELLENDSLLYLFKGKSEQVISQLLTHVDAVYLNRDYTPFSINRDNSIQNLCLESGKKFVLCDDLLLHRPENVSTKTGGTYQVFTPFYKKGCKSLQNPLVLSRILKSFSACSKTLFYHCLFNVSCFFFLKF